MASRLSSMRRPLVASAAVLATVTGAALVYRSRGEGVIAPQKALVPVSRDSNGRIQPPSFPAIKSRADRLAELGSTSPSSSSTSSPEYDLLIIGGGATGTGIALDAVTRGYKVALVERGDFASGTSSKSTKLVHGGVRYLEKAFWNLDYSQLELVMEGLHERKTFLQTAPHLSHATPILLPLQHYWQGAYIFAGTLAYDMLAGSQGIGGSYVLGKTKTLAKFPSLRKDSLVGGVVYYDGQQNDARMNVALAQTAALYGATVLNYVEVTGLEKDSNGKIVGATVKDVLGGGAGGEQITVKAKGVINATGPFADAVEQLDNPAHKPMVAPSSGVHVVLPADLCDPDMGMIKNSADGRVIFILPWEGHTIAGTTDRECKIEQNPVPESEDIDFVLGEVNNLLAQDKQLTRSDVLASWSGIRPLIRDPNSKNTESLVRNHLIKSSPAGLLTCVGGKWTTYRRMAEETVDAAEKNFGLKAQNLTLPAISGNTEAILATNGSCRTTAVPVVGAHGFSAHLASQLQEVHPQIDTDVAQYLATTYGDRAWAVLGGSSPKRLIPFSSSTTSTPPPPVTEDEVRYVVRNEMACTAEDVIARRTRLSFVDSKAALEVVPRVVEIMAEELHWDAARQALEKQRAVRFLASMGLDGGSRAMEKAAAPKATQAAATTSKTDVVPLDLRGQTELTQ